MKNTTLREALKTVPTLNPVMISVKDGVLFVSSYTPLYAILSISKTESSNITVLLSPEGIKTLNKMLNGKETDVTMELNGSNLRVKVGKKDSTFTTVTNKKVVEAAKKLRDENMTYDIECSAEGISAAINSVSHFSGNRTIADVRFHGYHMTVHKDYIEFMSSNNRGMAVTKVPATAEEEVPTFLIPKELQTILKATTGKLKLKVESGKRILGWSSTGDTSVKFSCTLVNGTPLAYNAILPKIEDVKNTIRTTKGEMLTAFSEGDFFAPDDQYKRINLSVQKDNVHISAANSENGALQADFEAQADHEDNFDLSYITLSELLGNTSNDILTIRVYDKRVVIENGSSNILAKFNS